ncbi:rRNA-processing protein UTP23 homolog [Takifugu flavidus]|uniref:rRNA-processing protein UTP23 homolog n=1 Tax=Takifugu flavidus TaxID=433684 RepID=A0A5C6NDG8_9TELE|nr:rRNA-processing protein UTP23 homolog [Takifugu flavidus]TWW65562.1 rRNA-processing protein UTP23 -like protein [Takifugu flavidus]
MKIKRQKQAKKTISFYKYSFNLREPFQILIDGTFCQAALKNKIQIKEQLPKYLMGEVQLCTTTCAMKELECLGKELYGAKIILQKYQTRRCAHTSPVPAAECLLSMLGGQNPHHYFIATQDRTLTTALKNIPGVPLLYIILNTIVLDKPSQRSLDYVQEVQMGELVSSGQQQKICSLKEEQGIQQKDKERRGRKRKRKQISPNPLSCLKKKKRKGVPTPPLRKAEGEQPAKRRRSRHKRPAHVSCPPEASDGP